MYRTLGGIAPASPGYASVTIAPQISRTLDPASANASVKTVRGVVTSNWTRHELTTESCRREGSRMGSRARGLAARLTMRVSVPVGATGELQVPLLGHTSETVVLAACDLGSDEEPTVIWAAGRDVSAIGASAWRHGEVIAEADRIVLSVAAAALELTLRVSC